MQTALNETTFLEELNRLSGQTIQLCYHCHKCTAGCPVASEMTYGPDRVLRLAQFGEKELLLTSHDIWLCASCETCGTRCPNEIDIARVMDALRAMALASGAQIAEADAIKFHKIFLAVVEKMGRMHEASMLVAYKLWTRHLLADMDSGVLMMMKGKVPLVPELIKGRQGVKRIFASTKEGKQG
ncbi:MAG: 4Fe-4S dicluster domain-containing protein, partial [Anaerolineales bacterium]|nr:4Fe-4S dicluster domain-containing protein [Anaerolineales bacterium]